MKHFKYKLGVEEMDRPAQNYIISFKPAVLMYIHEKDSHAFGSLHLFITSLRRLTDFSLMGNIQQHICIKILKPISKVF